MVRIEEDTTLLETSSGRYAMAIQVRLEDKIVLQETIYLMERWQKALDSNPISYPPSFQVSL